MKKIIFFIVLLSASLGFSQNNILLHIRQLFNNNNGTVYFNISKNNGTILYSKNGDIGSSSAVIFNLSSSDFPLKLDLYVNYTSGFNAGCNASKTVTYTYANYLNGDEVYLSGCTPNEISLYSDYKDKIVAGQSAKGVCESIQCNNAYSKDGVNWTPVAGNVTSIIPKNLPDLGPNFRGNLYVKSNFTVSGLYTFSPPSTSTPLPPVTMELKVRTYNIIGCSPNLVGTSFPNLTTCSNDNGSVEFTFAEPLIPGEVFLFNRNPVGNFIITSANSGSSPDIEKISPTKYKWKNIPAGVYNFRYQTQFNNNTPSSVVGPTNFTINKTLPLFFTATPINPPCRGDNAGITITASGGTPPYYYILGNSGAEVEFATPYNLYGLDPSKSYDVKVIDKNKCIENTP